MRSRLVQFTVIFAAILAYVYAGQYFREIFLPTVNPERRIWWIAGGTLILGVAMSLILTHGWTSRRFALSVRAFGLSGWLVLSLGYVSLGINFMIGDIFIIGIPLFAVAFLGPSYPLPKSSAEPVRYESRRLPFVVLAICGLIVLLASFSSVSRGALICLALYVLLQTACAVFPDLDQHH